jgi:predicted transcriptional regulator
MAAELKLVDVLIKGCAMTISSPEKPRHGPVTINLDDADQDRIASLASAKNSTPHYLMKAAILEYLQKEEARQNFVAAAEASFVHYKESGLHITLDEFDSWVDQVQQDPSAPLPTCHK